MDKVFFLFELKQIFRREIFWKIYRTSEFFFTIIKEYLYSFFLKFCYDLHKVNNNLIDEHLFEYQVMQNKQQLISWRKV